MSATITGVSKTAVLTLRARRDEHHREDRTFEDPVAVDWFDRVEWSDDLDSWYADGAQNNIALRVDDLDKIITRWAAVATVPSVVELGSGLSTRPYRLAGLGAQWTAIDLPEIAELRQAWDAPGRQLGLSVLDRAWMNELGEGPHVFVAEGLLYYLPRAEVDALFADLRKRFADSVFVMDVLGPSEFPKLEHHTRSLGTPVQWHANGPLKDLMDELGLEPPDRFAPDQLTKEALVRYFSRLPAALQMMSWWALNAGVLPPERTANVIGRLTPHQPSSSTR